VTRPFARGAECEAVLTEREPMALTRRFGLDGAAPESLTALGQRLGVTREWVRQCTPAAREPYHVAADDIQHDHSTLHGMLRAGTLHHEAGTDA
jgi:hypothetical protein